MTLVNECERIIDRRNERNKFLKPIFAATVLKIYDCVLLSVFECNLLLLVVVVVEAVVAWNTFDGVENCQISNAYVY